MAVLMQCVAIYYYSIVYDTDIRCHIIICYCQSFACMVFSPACMHAKEKYLVCKFKLSFHFTIKLHVKLNCLRKLVMRTLRILMHAWVHVACNCF